ncbi:hypothetical protein [Halalkalibacillus halophilus]|nr:hypothetical protein [Halalkalibacillus halophilus]
MKKLVISTVLAIGFFSPISSSAGGDVEIQNEPNPPCYFACVIETS